MREKFTPAVVSFHSDREGAQRAARQRNRRRKNATWVVSRTTESLRVSAQRAVPNVVSALTVGLSRVSFDESLDA